MIVVEKGNKSPLRLIFHYVIGDIRTKQEHKSNKYWLKQQYEC